MEHVKLLDCTLRDGAYLVEKKFGDTTIRGIIAGLIEAKIDIIEMGFLQNDGFGKGKTVFKNTAEAKKFIPFDKGNSLIALLADCSRYDVNNLDEYAYGSVDIIRECFFKNEKQQALENCYKIKQKGYKVFVQPVDILGYTDKELIDLIEEVNKLEPFGMSIVDTFGSMYQEDLHRVFEIINHNLLPSCKIGFHSHNNMQLSNALSQEFVRISTGKRKVVVDGTISGMGRGAGNTPTELIAQYLTTQLGYSYNMDVLLDLIDTYMDNIRAKCSWGYSTSYFVAGCYGAHVNNIAYLSAKNSIRHKDIRMVLNKLGVHERKRYDYDLLEQTYMEIMNSNIDDTEATIKLGKILSNKEILILAPGKTIEKCKNKIISYIENEKPIVISVNFFEDSIKTNYVYMNNVKRYQYWMSNPEFVHCNKIITSNIKNKSISDNEIVVSFVKMLHSGWELMDNSMIMLLRLLDQFKLKKITIAGFDGFTDSDQNENYYKNVLETKQTTVDAVHVNNEIEKMLQDYKKNREQQEVQISFLTPSRFEKTFLGDE